MRGNPSPRCNIYSGNIPGKFLAKEKFSRRKLSLLLPAENNPKKLEYISQ